MDITEIQRIIRDYYKQLYANKMDKLEIMDKFLEKYNFSRLNQNKIEKMNGQITSTEIKTVIKKKKKTSNKQKSRNRWLYRQILSKILRRANTYPLETFLKNCRGRDTPKFIQWGHHHPDTKTKDTTHKQITGKHHWWTQMQKSSTKY